MRRWRDSCPARPGDVAGAPFEVDGYSVGRPDGNPGAVFIVIFLAEWGYLTQILTAKLAAHHFTFLGRRGRPAGSLGRGRAGRDWGPRSP